MVVEPWPGRDHLPSLGVHGRVSSARTAGSVLVSLVSPCRPIRTTGHTGNASLIVSSLNPLGRPAEFRHMRSSSRPPGRSTRAASRA
jgi:hypothetical protein